LRFIAAPSASGLAGDRTEARAVPRHAIGEAVGVP
jgi:hypothetical protein